LIIKFHEFGVPVLYRDSVSNFQLNNRQNKTNIESMADIMNIQGKCKYEDVISFIDMDDDENLPNLTEELYEMISRETGSEQHL